MQTQEIHRIKFSINPPPIEIDLNIERFNPEAVFGSGWKFAPEINGLAENDGITSFQTVITKAVFLPKDEGHKLLFPLTLKGEANLTAKDKIKAFAQLRLADPDLLWSLYMEKGQKTLCYLHDTYGITWMESLRRLLVRPDGGQDSLYLHKVRRYTWMYGSYGRVNLRGDSFPALSLGN